MGFQVPNAIRGDRSTMYDRFVALAAEEGDAKSYAVELVRLLPLPLRRAPVWFDKLSKLWRYEYGLPFDRLPEDTLVWGANLFFPLEELYIAMRLADRWLTREQLIHFLERIEDKAKHTHAIFEMRPMAKLRTGLLARYEVSGLGIGNTTCDWQITGKLINVAFDVKYRTKSIISHMTHMIPGLNRGDANFGLRRPIQRISLRVLKANSRNNAISGNYRAFGFILQSRRMKSGWLIILRKA